MAKWFDRRLTAACLVFALLGMALGIATATGSIKLVSPKPGATLEGSVQIQAAVNAPEVSFVIFGVDGERCHSTNSRPYGFMLDTSELSDGRHVIFAEAYGRGGLLCRSAPVKVIVKNGSALPAPAPRPAVRQPEQAAPVARVQPQPKVNPGAAALTSRVESRAAAQESRPVTPGAEPRAASEQVSLPLAETPRPLPAVSDKPKVSLVPPSPTVRPIKPVVVVPSTPLGEGPSIVLNGSPLSLEVAPAIREGRLEAGFRKILSSAGWRVSWHSSTKTGVAHFEGHQIEVVVGEKNALIDGQIFSLGREAKITNSRLIIPVRPLCRAAGIDLRWDQKTRTARLFSPYSSASAKTVAAAR
jgi:hypothetical protein